MTKPQVAVVEESSPSQDQAQPDMDFKKMLKALISMPGVEGALIVRPDGLVVEAEWNVQGETDLYGALTAESAKNAALKMRESGFGNLESMQIETEGTLTYVAAAKGRILAVICSESVNLGSLKLKLASLMPRLSG
jgi:predicted regulator of Ras-like GTPase activity (Roadblock/LC7/MglB family)